MAERDRERGRDPLAVAAWVLLVLVVGGAVALLPDLAVLWVLVATLPFVVIAVCRLLSGPKLLVDVGLVIGAAVIPLFALLGVDWLWAQAGGGHLAPIPSVIVGAAIVWLAAVAYLRPWWVRKAAGKAFLWGGVVAFVLVVLPPLVFLAIGEFKGDERTLDMAAAVVSKLDVVVLTEAGASGDVDPARARGWQVRPIVGTVAGDEVRWGPDGPPPPAPETGVDRVIVLLVGAREPGEVERWMALVDGLGLEPTPTFALLVTADEDRLRGWQPALARRGGEPHSAEEFAARTTTDVALRLGVLAATSDSDLALAARHRPALFFDGREPYPKPLNIDNMLASGKVHLCDRGQDVRALCPVLDGSAELHNGADHLAFDPDELESVEGSTVYVRVTRSGNDHPNTIYLDYWWYFPHNPTGAGGGAFCGAGFVIAGVTCHDHQSDWEGVTVILDADSGSDTPTAVAYAQHNGVTRYSWRALQALWDQRDRRDFGAGIDTTRRPLVFVARGTHASYPVSCRRDKCEVGGVPGVEARRPFNENRHDGATAWEANEQTRCVTSCVEALPTRANGEAARWNAFAGYWGSTDCSLGVFCSSSSPPRAPSRQRRYGSPWCTSDSFSFDGRFARKRGGCPGRVPSADELERGETLLALGDSFSSGQGAGSYDLETTGGGNTCFRSRLSWPQVLARSLRLTPRPALACSGAVSREVLANDDGRKERERRVSQVSRISGDPDVVTITIGGNDVGFAKVLEHCVFDADCTKRYRRPTGDLLDREIEDLAARLFRVYAAIRRAAPDARLVVVGYPRLFPEKKSSAPVGNCAAGRRISAREVEYLNDRTRVLNAAIAGVANKSGADFVDVTEAFDGAELRCEGKTYVNRLRLREKLFPASFHPNTAGHTRLADVVAAHLAAK